MSSGLTRAMLRRERESLCSEDVSIERYYKKFIILFVYSFSCPRIEKFLTFDIGAYLGKRFSKWR